jgi:hypothetical protein
MLHELRKLNSPTQRLIIVLVFILFLIPVLVYVLNDYQIDQGINNDYFSQNQTENLLRVNRDQERWGQIKIAWEKYENEHSLSEDERQLIDALLVAGVDVSHEIKVRFQAFEWAAHPLSFKADATAMVNQIEALITGPLSASYSPQQIKHYKTLQTRLNTLKTRQIKNHNPFFFYWFFAYENIAMYLSFVVALVFSIVLMHHGQASQSLGWLASHKKTKNSIMLNQLLAFGAISLISVFSLYMMLIVLAIILFGPINPLMNVQSIYQLRYMWPSMTWGIWFILKIIMHAFVVYGIILGVMFLYRLVKSQLVFALLVTAFLGAWVAMSVSNIDFLKSISFFAYLGLSNQFHTLDVFLLPKINMSAHQLMNVLLIISVLGFFIVLWYVGIADQKMIKSFELLNQKTTALYHHTKLRLHQWTSLAINKHGILILMLVIGLFASISVYESKGITSAGLFNQKLYPVYEKYQKMPSEAVDEAYNNNLALIEEYEILKEKATSQENLNRQDQERLAFLEQSNYERALFMNFYNNIAYHEDMTYHFGYQQFFSINSTQRESFKILLLMIVILLAGHLTTYNDRSLVVEAALSQKSKVLINEKIIMMLVSVVAFVLLSALDLYLISSRYPMTSLSHEVSSILVHQSPNWRIDGLIQANQTLGVSMLFVLGVRLLALINVVLVWLIIQHITLNKWISSFVVILGLLTSALWMAPTSYFSLYSMLLGSHVTMLNPNTTLIYMWISGALVLSFTLRYLIKNETIDSNITIKA